MNHESSPARQLTGIFSTLNDVQRERIAALGTFSKLPVGYYVVKQGDSHDFVHLLLEGTLAVSCQGFARVIELGDILAGELVGELNFVDPMKASASVRAKTHCEVWTIPCQALKQYCLEDTAAGLFLVFELSRLLARRIRKGSERMLRQAETAAAIAIHDRDF